ncbi:MAG: hypothetical protein DRG24_02085 [Epsilonproteobacteria bacterium]|nr:MAG: hypothetical protein DRG24_02085 [Campylobacterota bacterium]
MTNSAQITHDDSFLAVNPFIIFFTIFLMPYILFFLLMMAITGLVEPMLIVDAIIKKSSTDFIKVWVIGSFVLSIFTTLYLSGINVKQYVQNTMGRRPKLSGGSHQKEEVEKAPPPTDDMIEQHPQKSAAKLPVKTNRPRLNKH